MASPPSGLPEYAAQVLAPMRLSPPPPPHVKRKFNPPPSPPKRQGSIYSNAWDVDYGIQRYAAALQGGPNPISPMPWPTHPGQEAHAAKKKGKVEVDPEEEQEFTVWAERAEASSRDGDDEDDEEEEESPVLSPKSAARRRAAKAKGKSYRHQGVQTEPKKTEDRGVQVSVSTMPSKRPYEFGSSPQQRPQKQSFGMQHSSPPGMGGRYSPLQHRHDYPPNRDEALGDLSFFPSAEITALAASVVDGRDVGPPMEQIIRKREPSEDSVTSAADSSIISSPQKETNEMETPRIGITVPEPIEQPAITARPGLSNEGSVRRTSRVFSPTTGVDIFKRGSEEVLARFLMQQPPGWDAARHASPGPPTPSAIH
jgi:glycogenin glucosyltransferase